MKLVSFMKNDQCYPGIVINEEVIDLEKWSRKHRVAPVTSIIDMIKNGSSLLKELENLTVESTSGCSLKLETVTLGPCVPDPDKIICVGLNYKKHAVETNTLPPEHPILFSKFPNSLAGHQQAILIPRVTEKLDYEAELVIVIGKEAKNVPPEKAQDFIFGYTIANDLSARDIQMRTSQWLAGKSCDGFCPLGPCVVTKDEIRDPNFLQITTTLNGELRQSSNTSDMIFDCNKLVSSISELMTLYPGDLILTGTPEGVILGYPEKDQHYLKAGDEVVIEIEQIGSLKNSFVSE
ncbi:fumarylacetoacetate hydrolase family protein [Fictibacillus sp. B-59209]|uniref:fumarylacetoacetate hydrolase family protein n=1 Tax=Fictibacillus sp. B-59209 TaxID=3024873 RepID=UPI002E1F318F|nr:fumarylacetoacetate hydrolase family protein [Fictibacillus sp. B-59209]